MKRKALSLTVCVVLLLSLLTACNGEPTDNTTTTTADSTVTTTTTTKFSGTTMTFAQGPQASATTSTTTKTKTTKPRVKEVNGIPVPQPAYDEGMCKLAFQDEFDSMKTFDFNGTGGPGYNWYIESDLNRSQPTTKDYKILAERDGAKGVFALEPKTAKTFDFDTYSRKGKTGYLWHFGYAECRMRFNVENVPKTEGYGGPRQGWHSFWSRDVRDYLHTGWEHSVELDMFEAWPFQENYPEKGISFSGALHHWIHSSVAGTSKNKDIAAPIAFGKFGGGTNQAYRLDSDWHTYGALWKEDYVAWYMDGKFLHAVEFGEDKLPVYYIGEEKREAVETANIFPGVFSVLNTQQMVVTVGGGDTTWPQYVDFVRVWEFS